MAPNNSARDVEAGGLTAASDDVLVDLPMADAEAAPAAPGAMKGADSVYYLGQSTARATTLLEPIPPEHEITLTFNHVNSWVPNLNLGQPGKSSLLKRLGGAGAGDAAAKDAPPSKRQILFNVSGAARPGEVLALMGPSGSGKTSLISILGGRAASVISVEGEILFNDQKPGKSMKRKMGFVLQVSLAPAHRPAGSAPGRKQARRQSLPAFPTVGSTPRFSLAVSVP